MTFVRFNLISFHQFTQKSIKISKYLQSPCFGPGDGDGWKCGSPAWKKILRISLHHYTLLDRLVLQIFSRDLQNSKFLPDLFNWVRPQHFSIFDKLSFSPSLVAMGPKGASERDPICRKVVKHAVVCTLFLHMFTTVYQVCALLFQHDTLFWGWWKCKVFSRWSFHFLGSISNLWGHFGWKHW